MKLSNYAIRNPMRGQRLHNPKPLMSEEEYQARKNHKEPTPPKSTLTAKRVKRIAKYMRHIKRCQKKGHRPRSVPRDVLELIIAHKLY